MLNGNVSRTTIENGLLAELTELSAEAAPRRFAICLLDTDRDDGVVLGWGLALDDQAIAYVPAEGCGQPCLVCSGSAEQLPKLLCRSGDARLIWIDAE
jgi:hypothetical protein